MQKDGDKKRQQGSDRAGGGGGGQTDKKHNRDTGGWAGDRHIVTRTHTHDGMPSGR